MSCWSAGTERPDARPASRGARATSVLPGPSSWARQLRGYGYQEEAWYPRRLAQEIGQTLLETLASGRPPADALRTFAAASASREISARLDRHPARHGQRPQRRAAARRLVVSIELLRTSLAVVLIYHILARLLSRPRSPSRCFASVWPDPGCRPVVSNGCIRASSGHARLPGAGMRSAADHARCLADLVGAKPEASRSRGR